MPDLGKLNLATGIRQSTKFWIQGLLALALLGNKIGELWRDPENRRWRTTALTLKI